MSSHLLASIALAVLLAPALGAQESRDPKLDQLFYEKKSLVLAEAARRHYEIASWCHKRNLVSQCTSELLYSVEISDQRYKPANRSLDLMRRFEDEFSRRVAVVGSSPQPVAHIDLVLTPLGSGRIALADSQLLRSRSVERKLRKRTGRGNAL